LDDRYGFTDFVFAGFLHATADHAKVPYKDPVTAGTDLAENRIQVYMPAYAIVRPQVEADESRYWPSPIANARP